MNARGPELGTVATMSDDTITYLDGRNLGHYHEASKRSRNELLKQDSLGAAIGLSDNDEGYACYAASKRQATIAEQPHR